VRFFLDENESEVILGPLRLLYDSHEFVVWSDEQLGGLDDVPLFEALAVRGFDALITRDKNQLSDKNERRALIEAGLHWIGHKEPEAGLAGLASLTAGYISAFPHILEHLESRPPCTAFHVSRVPRESGQRLRIRLLRVDDEDNA
jgi:PIN like domain